MYESLNYESTIPLISTKQKKFYTEIVNNSTNINNKNKHLSLSLTEHNKEHDIVYHVKNPNPVLGQTQDWRDTAG